MTDAREYLEQIETLDRLIDGKLNEEFRLRCLAESITAPTDREPGGVSGHGDKVGNLVSRLVDLQNEIAEAVDRYIDRHRECVAVVEAVKKPLHYTILHGYYLDRKSLVQIAEETGYSYGHICEEHLNALQTVQEILEKRETKKGASP